MLNLRYQIYLYFSFLFVGLLTSICIPQQQSQAEISDSLRIIKIINVGNDKTKDNVILREMKVQVGDLYDEQRVEEDRKRIQNLQLFTRVEIHPARSERGIVLVIWTAERWYIFPVPLLYLNERDWDKLSYGASLNHQNFRGRNEDVYVAFWLGYNPGTELEYSNPWFGGALKLYTSLSLYKKKIRNRSSDFERFNEKYMGFTWNIGKRFGYHTFFTLGLSYRKLSVDLADPTQVTLSSDGTDELPGIGFSFNYDTRDLHEYPKDGIFIKLSTMKTGFGGSIDYNSYAGDLRYYLPIVGAISVGTRLSGNFNTGINPVYNREFFGYNERIRGHFYEKREGNNRILTSMELRFPIVQVFYVDLDSGPNYFSGYSNNLKFGVSGGIFFDSGAVWYDHNQLNRDQFISGFGAGLHFHLPYVDLLRVEYAVDMRGRGQVIFDLGKSF